MLNSSTFDKLSALRLHAMAQAWQDQQAHPDHAALSFDERFGLLVDAQWLGRENRFPEGVILLTGTGVVPPDDFALGAGDLIHIDITGIGRLTNRVEQGG